MEPIPETVAAIEELGPYAGGGNLLEQLLRLGDSVSSLVPDVVGLSLASVEHGVTFTVVASDEKIALLDAIQYLAGGPCVDAADDGEVTTFAVDDALDEEEWLAFARATSARGVASTLTLPIFEGIRVTGTINLYGASENAFTGHHEALASIAGAWAPGAVTNADLAFITRREAEQAPHRLHDQSSVEVAAQLVAGERGIGVAEARRQLREAASRAGITEQQLADAVINLGPST